MNRFLALITTTVALGTSAGHAQSEVLKLSECTHVRWTLSDGVTDINEWLCPKGISFVQKSHFMKSDSVEEADNNDSRCTFYSPENAWICPSGFAIWSADKSIVYMPKAE